MELLVVMGIIAIVVATSVPAMTGYARQVRLKASTREALGLLSLARSLAISSRSTKTVLVDAEQHELVIEETLQAGDPRRMRLPDSIQLAVQTQGQSGPAESVTRLTFQPSGALLGRSVSLRLSSGTRTQTIAITATTGSIAVQ